ncbi:MAG: class III lanthionine synthetase LanKC [Defluviitaleaceae bacterium]|nr:class III lanthionine synthetase LanKC [Defluviitaleaceae bacterium]
MKKNAPKNVSFTANDLDSDWQVYEDDPNWNSYYPIEKSLDNQGFKIHVSTTYENASLTLKKVSPVLNKFRVPFKHIKNKQVLFQMYSKIGSRISAGKFITIYPSEGDFELLLNELDQVLVGLEKGPYILTDKRWKEGNIYFRYGAFKEIFDEKGIRCIYHPDGKLVPDLRNPWYELPDFIEEPAFIKQTGSENESTLGENKLSDYKIEQALSFSNAGGIYRGVRIDDKKPCVIKESRPAIGLDWAYQTAEQRLHNAYEALKKLSDIPEIPDAIDYFKVWENTYLVEAFFEGITLHHWIKKNYPRELRSDSAVYVESALSILKQLRQLILQVHEKGVSICDLQPGNVLITEDLEVRVIDFETSGEISEKSNFALRTHGFYHLLNEKTSDEDWYAFNRLVHYCFLPIVPVSHLNMNLNIRHIDWIHQSFGSKVYEYFQKNYVELSEKLSNYDLIFGDTYFKAQQLTKDDIVTKIDEEKLRKKLINGLLSNCDISSESLINGDIRQFELDCGKLNIQTGGFGAVLTLLKANVLADQADQINDWIQLQSMHVLNTPYNNGFLTGRTGIAAVLYECDDKEKSKILFEKVLKTYDKQSKDFSLRSGLSGIGLSFLGWYKVSQEECFLLEAKEIAYRILTFFDSDGKMSKPLGEEISFGLLDGYSGIALFMLILYNLTKEQLYLESFSLMIAKDLDKLNSEEKNSVLPSLANGWSGVGYVLQLFGKTIDMTKFNKHLDQIKRRCQVKIGFDFDLFEGFSGYYFLDKELKETFLKNLQLFMIESEKGTYVSPGKWGHKLSADVATGLSGIILALEFFEKENFLGWFPLVGDLFDCVKV